MMTEDEMNELAIKIVNKIFERQEQLDAEFMADMLEDSIVIQANNIEDLQYALRLAEETENYELAAKLKKQIDKLNKIEFKDLNLIIRKKYDGFPRKVEYSLTTLGCSLKPLVEVMLKWEKNNSKKINYLLKKKFLDSIYDYY